MTTGPVEVSQAYTYTKWIVGKGRQSHGPVRSKPTPSSFAPPLFLSFLSFLPLPPT